MGYYALIDYPYDLLQIIHFTLAGAFVVLIPDHFWLQQQLNQLDEKANVCSWSSTCLLGFTGDFGAGSWFVVFGFSGTDSFTHGQVFG